MILNVTARCKKMYSRIILKHTYYKPQIPFIDAMLVRNFNFEKLQEVYRTYCLHKRFHSVMPLVIEEYTYPQSDLHCYFESEELAGFTLLFKYNTTNVAAAQFAWTYHKPWKQLGIKSLEYLCAYYKAQGYEYLYLGGHEIYKQQLQGYELCPPMS